MLLAYWLTESAGKYGTLMIVLATSFFYAINYQKGAKWLLFVKSITALIIFISAFAYINEHVTKQVIRATRPSHVYILKQTQSLQYMDTIVNMSKSERQHFFSELIQSNKQTFATVDEQVIQHWLEESGYSFPSGHSFNAFLLATILSFSLLHSRNSALHKWYVVPFVWALLVALSRVALGAHSALDIYVGASGGFAVACVFLYFRQSRTLILKKHH